MRLRTWSVGMSVSSYSRYPTFSATVSESKSAFSWNSMPMSAAHAHEIALGHALDSLTIDENRAGVGSKQSENELEHDRLPGAARAEQDFHASLRDAEADVAEDDVLVEGERHLVEHHGGRDRVLTRHPDRR